MTRNNIMKIIFILILGIFTVYPLISFAACEDDSLNKAREENNKELKAAMVKFESAAANFNSAAQGYISACGEPDKQKDDIELPDAKIASRIADDEVNYDYNKEEYWKNTKYFWDQVEASSEQCKSLLQAVKDAKFGENGFDKCRDNVNELANKASNIDKNLCECDQEQKDIMCESVSEEESAQNNATCKKFPEYLEEFNSCPLCGLFRSILSTIAKVSSIAWHAVSGPLSNVVKIFFLVLLAVEVLKAVSAVGGTRLSEFGKNVLLLCFKAAITILLLSNPRYIYGYFLSPVIEGGLNMGVAIAQTGGPGGHIAVSQEDKLGISSDTFDNSVYDSVISTVREFGKSASMLPAIGRGLTCYAWNDKNYGLPNISMWISGAIFYIFGIMIWLAVSFYMIDCTIQIGMLSGLVPLLIACWPFKMTESYSYKGCKMLMNSFFSYVMMGIVLLLGTQITTAAISGDAQSIALAINNSDLPALRKACDLGAFQLLILVACAIFAMKLIGQTNSLADQFSKGAGSSMGTRMGGATMSAITSMGKGAAHLGGRVASVVGKNAADATGVTATFNKGTDAIKGAWQKSWAKAGRGVGLGKYQNQQIGSGKEGNNTDNKENKQPEYLQNNAIDSENINDSTDNPIQENENGYSTNSQNDNPTPNENTDDDILQNDESNSGEGGDDDILQNDEPGSNDNKNDDISGDDESSLSEGRNSEISQNNNLSPHKDRGNINSRNINSSPNRSGYNTGSQSVNSTPNNKYDDISQNNESNSGVSEDDDILSSNESGTGENMDDSISQSDESGFNEGENNEILQNQNNNLNQHKNSDNINSQNINSNPNRYDKKE